MTQSSGRRKKYSYFYVVYRKARFLRYKKRQKRLHLETIEKEEQERDFKAAHIELQLEKVNKTREKEKRKADRTQRRIERRVVRERQRIEYEKTEKLRKQQEQELRKKLLIEKSLERQKKRTQTISYVKKLPGYWIRSISQFNLSSVNKSIKKFRDYREVRRIYTVIFLNSLSLFLLSYFTIYFISQLSTMVTASFFDYSTIFYYWEIYFNITEEDWTPEAIKLVFASGPFFSLVTGIVCLFVYISLNETTYKVKTFFLWAFFHGMTFFFGAIVIGTLFEKGIGYTIGWMYIMDTGKVIYSTVSLFILVATGLMITGQSMFSANSYFTYLNQENRRMYMYSNLFLPYLAGIIILSVLRQPKFMFYETFMVISTGLIVIPIMLAYGSQEALLFDFEDKKVKTKWIYILSALGIMALYRYVGEMGLGF